MAQWAAGLLRYSLDGSCLEEVMLVEGMHVFADRLGQDPEAAGKVHNALRRVLQEKLGWGDDARGSTALFSTLGVLLPFPTFLLLLLGFALPWLCCSLCIKYYCRWRTWRCFCVFYCLHCCGLCSCCYRSVWRFSSCCNLHRLLCPILNTLLTCGATHSSPSLATRALVPVASHKCARASALQYRQAVHVPW